jgi:hypothetical protein
VVVAIALCAAADLSLPPLEVAALCRRAEHRAVGVPSGIMDQAASLLGRAEHALYLVAACVFWWPVVVGTPGGSQLRELAKVGYLGGQLIAMKPVFVYLTFSRYPQYATYELAPRISNISARADQQMAGLLMEVAGMIIILIFVGAVGSCPLWIKNSPTHGTMPSQARLGSRKGRRVDHG